MSSSGTTLKITVKDKGKERAPEEPRVYKTNNSLALIDVKQEPAGIQSKMRKYQKEEERLREKLSAFADKQSRMTKNTPKSERDQVEKDIAQFKGQIKGVRERGQDLRDRNSKDEAKRLEKK
jgi:hypothetical protein